MPRDETKQRRMKQKQDKRVEEKKD